MRMGIPSRGKKSLNGIATGEIAALMEIKQPIPSKIIVNGRSCLAFYPGQKQTCFLCNGPDHQSAQCPQRNPVSRPNSTLTGAPSYAVALNGRPPSPQTLLNAESVNEDLLKRIRGDSADVPEDPSSLFIPVCSAHSSLPATPKGTTPDSAEEEKTSPQAKKLRVANTTLPAQSPVQSTGTELFMDGTDSPGPVEPVVPKVPEVPEEPFVLHLEDSTPPISQIVEDPLVDTAPKDLVAPTPVDSPSLFSGVSADTEPATIVTTDASSESNLPSSVFAPQDAVPMDSASNPLSDSSSVQLATPYKRNKLIKKHTSRSRPAYKVNVNDPSIRKRTHPAPVVGSTQKQKGKGKEKRASNRFLNLPDEMQELQPSENPDFIVTDSGNIKMVTPPPPVNQIPNKPCPSHSSPCS